MVIEVMHNWETFENHRSVLETMLEVGCSLGQCISYRQHQVIVAYSKFTVTVLNSSLTAKYELHRTTDTSSLCFTNGIFQSSLNYDLEILIVFRFETSNLDHSNCSGSVSEFRFWFLRRSSWGGGVFESSFLKKFLYAPLDKTTDRTCIDSNTPIVGFAILERYL